MSFTLTQKLILRAMFSGEPTMFTGHNARRNGFSIYKTVDGKEIVVRCYGTPQYFLKERGLIELVDYDMPGYWYGLTDKGRAEAK